MHRQRRRHRRRFMAAAGFPWKAAPSCPQNVALATTAAARMRRAQYDSTAPSPLAPLPPRLHRTARSAATPIISDSAAAAATAQLLRGSMGGLARLLCCSFHPPPPLIYCSAASWDGWLSCIPSSRRGHEQPTPNSNSRIR
jgi:hypothetical protein